ncbi:MAG TPA: hypothetical protein VHK65_16870 [Candidatus Dormibacteraeota bacterium]|nr:hypothetical protein [Candidatus Dormibacteraeota bacterium]
MGGVFPAETLEKSIVGDVITRSNPAYDEARKIWNGDIDRRPVAIARCTSAGDVVAALRAGLQSGLPIAVRWAGTASRDIPFATVGW